MNCFFCEASIDAPSLSPAGNGIVGCPKCFNPMVVQVSETGSSLSVVDEEDLRDIVLEGSVLHTMFAKTEELIKELPVMDDVYQRVFTTLNDPVANSHTIAEVISEDAALTMRVLKLVNSAYYSRGQEINSLSLACSQLGLRNIGQIASACAAESMFRCPDKRFEERSKYEWCHALATARCIEKLSFLDFDAIRDDLYIAALLHNIGRVVLLNLLSSDRFGSTEQLRNSPKNIDRILDTYAGIMSLQVARLNQLSAATAAAIFFHRRPGDNPVEEWAKAAYGLGLAEFISQLAWPTPDDETKAEDLDPKLVELGGHFGMGPGRIVEILGEIVPDVREFIISHQ